MWVYMEMNTHNKEFLIKEILGLSPSKEVGEPEMMKCKHNVIGIHCAQCLPGKVQFSDNLKEDCGWDGDGPCPKHIATLGTLGPGFEATANVCRLCAQAIESDGSCHCRSRSSKPKDSEVWCPNIIGDSWYVPGGDGEYYGTLAKKWTHCPCHGTPRPTPKSLAEKLRDGCIWTFVGKDVVSSPHWETLAEIAEKHFKK